MSTWTEHFIDNGPVSLRVLEQGTGPAVVLCHGFPGLAYSWRHQMPALAAAGYRVIAPDLRGFGGSDAPLELAEYDRSHTVQDMVAILDALDIADAVFCGHDFGAALVWDLPQWAPGRVRALIQLSVPRQGVHPSKSPSQLYGKRGSVHFLHFHYFQQPGVADAELDGDPALFLQRVFWALSGGGDYPQVFTHPPTVGYTEALPEAPPLPWSWLSVEEFDEYVDRYTAHGFTGGLNWYRAADHVWQEKLSRPDEPIELPVCFITGDRDPVQLLVGPSAMDHMRASVPGLREEHVLPDVGHFVQMEAAEEVNAVMIDFLSSLN